jgi:hypothetical protein
MAYRFNNKQTFPLHFEFFPQIHGASLIANAFHEVKAITQAPDPLIYSAILGSVSVASQGSINVELPIDKVVPAPLMMLMIADSGERKSTVQNLLTKGMKLFQQNNLKGYQKKLNEYKIRLELHENQTTQIRKSVNLNDQVQREEVVGKLIEHERCRPVKPKLSLLSFEDTTPEALFFSLSENIPNGILISSEGGIIFNSRAFVQTPAFSSIWSGDSVIVNRKSVESFTLEGARLTVSIMVQPSSLERFVKKNKDDVRGNGFLSRFLVCAPPSNCGFRQINSADYHREGLQSFNDRVYQLLTESAELEDFTLKAVIGFSSEAKRIWFDICNDIELNMGPDGVFQYAKDHASKLPENIARLAALIHYFNNSSEKEISAATLMESINLMGYFSAQFLSVFCAPPKYITDAQNLTQWLGVYADSGVRYIKRNNILQYGPSGTRKKTDLEAALGCMRANNKLAEIISRKTRVIDLWPQQPFDEAKLNQDLLQDIVF